jgi:hypothetical protein
MRIKMSNIRMMLIITLINLLIITSTFAQSPQNISYQAVIRNSSNALVTSSPVGMRISILQGSATGIEIYKEIYNPNPQTNANGLVTVEIGGGVPLTGTFAAIDWSAGQYFILTETDPTGGTNYTISGTSQLLSVPYAKYADEAGNGFSGNYNDLTNLPTLATVATTGSYTDLINQPSLSTIATTGSYNDLTGVPANIDIDKTDDVLLTGNQTIAGNKTFTGTVAADSLVLTKKISKYVFNTYTVISHPSSVGDLTISHSEYLSYISSSATGVKYVMIGFDLPYQVLGVPQKIKSVTINYQCESTNVSITALFFRKSNKGTMATIASPTVSLTSTTVAGYTFNPASSSTAVFTDQRVYLDIGITFNGTGGTDRLRLCEFIVETY